MVEVAFIMPCSPVNLTLSLKSTWYRCKNHVRLLVPAPDLVEALPDFDSINFSSLMIWHLLLSREYNGVVEKWGSETMTQRPQGPLED